jgi:hypothetical protein
MGDGFMKTDGSIFPRALSELYTLKRLCISDKHFPWRWNMHMTMIH